MVDLAALESERDGRGGDVADVAQAGREQGIDLLDQVGGDVGGRGEDDVVGEDAAAVAENDFVAICRRD